MDTQNPDPLATLLRHEPTDHERGLWRQRISDYGEYAVRSAVDDAVAHNHRTIAAVDAVLAKRMAIATKAQRVCATCKNIFFEMKMCCGCCHNFCFQHHGEHYDSCGKLWHEKFMRANAGQVSFSTVVENARRLIPENGLWYRILEQVARFYDPPQHAVEPAAKGAAQ